MGLPRRSLLALAGGCLATTAGCLSNDLPLFQVDVYNATDSTVTASVEVERTGTGTVVVDDAVRVAGSDGKRRETVAESFEKGTRYEVVVSVGDRSNGELFRADREGARKLTFEVDESAIRTEFA